MVEPVAGRWETGHAEIKVNKDHPYCSKFARLHFALVILAPISQRVIALSFLRHITRLAILEQYLES